MIEDYCDFSVFSGFRVFSCFLPKKGRFLVKMHDLGFRPIPKKNTFFDKKNTFFYEKKRGFMSKNHQKLDVFGGSQKSVIFVYIRKTLQFGNNIKRCFPVFTVLTKSFVIMQKRVFKNDPKKRPFSVLFFEREKLIKGSFFDRFSTFFRPFSKSKNTKKRPFLDPFWTPFG